MPETTSIEDRLGIEEGKLALGLDPEEVLTFCGR
jgi:hypothetical protein